MNKFSYDVDRFYFHRIVSDFFNIDNLSNIHGLINNLEIPDDPSKDQKTIFHKMFYRIYEDNDCEFLRMYRAFVLYLCELHFADKNMIYQTKPTFRVHAPNNIAVAQWHKDKAYNHSHEEINIYLPLTDAFDSNTIWSESVEDLGDYAPMNAKLGEYYVWNGANLLHGNKKNETGVSRVSIDFRLINETNFLYDGTSVTSKVPMKLGHYWNKL